MLEDELRREAHQMEELVSKFKPDDKLPPAVVDKVKAHAETMLRMLDE